MRELEEKIRQGVVDPGAIGAEIIDLLEVSTDIPVIPEQLEQTEADQEILLTVFDEVDQCLKKELIAPTEAFLVKAESVRFLELYRAGYPSMSHTTCLELVRDNARKIVYQTARDKEVFSGSDHGTRHIIEGNIKFADQLTNSLEKQLGHPLSARDKVLIHQAIIDHDCGYSCGCAQAKRGFEASKDHPLFSTKFIDANMDYYREKFGAKGASTIRTAVLYHSYPISDYRIESSEDTAVNPNIVRSVMSTVDSLGVTAETKTPAFFRKPEAIRVLLRLQLALETSPEKDAKGSRVLSEHALNAFKNELSHVAEQEPNARRREGFTRSINDFFSEYTAKTTLGHYTGLVKHVGVEQLPNGSIVPKVEMSMSRIHALLGNMFGGAMETEAFVKTMQTFGLTKQSTERLGKTLEAQRKNKAATGETIKIENERAVFEISTNLSDAEARDFPAVLDVVQEAYALSVRLDVQETIHTLRKQPEQADKIAGHLGEKMMGLFLESNDPRLDSDDIQRLHNILQHISDDPSEEHIRALETFTTNKERAYISLPSPTL